MGQKKPEILTELCHGYDDSTVAMSTGIMLRACFKADSLVKIVLHSEVCQPLTASYLSLYETEPLLIFFFVSLCSS